MFDGDAPRRAAVAFQLTHHEGPLPDPITMRGYGDMSPDFPERIMRMAEKAVDSQIETRRSEANAVAFTVRAAYALAGLALVAGLILGMAGHTEAAIGAFSTGVLIGEAQVIRSIKGKGDSSPSESV